MRGTIKSSDEIDHLFKTGNKVKIKGMMLLIGSTPEGRDQQFGRVAFIAGKNTGNSPRRNLAKRIMRSIACDLGAPWRGFDVVFVANSRIFSLDYDEVLTSVRQRIKEMGLL